ncbi:AAA family ATPase, partial [archaeon]|nr:AAA family ATPase [archaeon]
ANERTKIIECSTVSKELSNSIALLLQVFGIVASIKDKKEWNGNISFRVSFAGVENFNAFKHIGFIDIKRNDKITEYIKAKKWNRGDLIPLQGKLAVFAAQAGNDESNLNIGRGKLMQLLLEKDSERQLTDLWALAENDIYWDKVVEVKEIESKSIVYDIEVMPMHNFMTANGIFAHNSEKGIRKVFQRARQVSPVIIFFDEIDSIASRRWSERLTKTRGLRF